MRFRFFLLLQYGTKCMTQGAQCYPNCLTLCSFVRAVVGAVPAARGLQLERVAEELQEQMRAVLTESQVGGGKRAQCGPACGMPTRLPRLSDLWLLFPLSYCGMAVVVD